MRDTLSFIELGARMRAFLFNLTISQYSVKTWLRYISIKHEHNLTHTQTTPIKRHFVFQKSKHVFFQFYIYSGDAFTLLTCWNSTKAKNCINCLLGKSRGLLYLVHEQTYKAIRTFRLLEKRPFIKYQMFWYQADRMPKRHFSQLNSEW